MPQRMHKTACPHSWPAQLGRHNEEKVDKETFGYVHKPYVEDAVFWRKVSNV